MKTPLVLRPDVPGAASVEPPHDITKWYVFAFPALMLVAQFALAPNLFTDPRFWAEEATNYYAIARDTSWTYIFTYVFNANYQFLTNLLTWLATFATPLRAPAVTTHLSIAILAGICAQFGALMRQWRVPPEVAILALLAWICSGVMIEVFATATNVQWIIALSVLMLCVSDLRIGRWGFFAVALWVIACGLTGIPSTVMTPFLLARAWLSRSGPHLVLGILLGFCALVQLGVIATHSLSNREFFFAPRMLFGPLVLQTFYTPLLGTRASDALGTVIRAADGFSTFLACLALALIAVAAAIASAKARALAVLLACLWLFVSVIQTLGALGDFQSRVLMIAALYGARYFVSGSLAIILIIVLASQGRGRFFAAAALALMVGNGFYDAGRTQRHWAAIFPSWSAQLAKCPPGPCRIPVWPGFGFAVTVPR